MQKVDIIKLAKKLKKALKEVAKPKKSYVSYSRRIEKIKTGKRICAMTFDDGPTKAEGLTESLVDILNQFGAKGTFDVIGTTENNYPDAHRWKASDRYMRRALTIDSRQVPYPS